MSEKTEKHVDWKFIRDQLLNDMKATAAKLEKAYKSKSIFDHTVRIECLEKLKTFKAYAETLSFIERYAVRNDLNDEYFIVGD